MKSYKMIVTLLVIPALLLVGCSGAAVALSSSAAAAAPATVSNPVEVAAPVVNQTTTAQPASLADLQSTFEQIYAQVDPSVVNIQVYQNASGNATLQLPQGNPGFGFSSPSQGVQEALGSGFVWDTKGDIVTNNHVVAGASKILVTFSDGTTVPAKLVGAAPTSDLAVIQVTVSASQLHPVTLADSNSIKVGQLVIAIGNPYGLSGTMTQGIISGLARELPVSSSSSSTSQGGQYAIPDIIQTDAAINPGNSGGVLVNANGDVVGVTSAIQSPVDANSGIGFVIPSSIVNKVVPQLISTGQYQHPWIGISGTSLNYDLAQAMNLNPQQRGALVVSVTPNSPAAKAGLQGSTSQVDINGQATPVGGDVITAIDGNPVNSFEDLSSYLVNNTQVGQTVTLTILRQGQQQTVKLTLGVMPQQLGQ